MQRNLRIFNFYNVPVFCHISCLAWALAIPLSQSFVGGAAIAAGIFIILLSHELGHLFMARWLGVPVGRVTIYGLWGLTWFRQPEQRGHHALICWGGVSAQFIVFAITALIVMTTTIGQLSNVLGSARVIVPILLVASPIIALFNLLPVGSLDGRYAWKIIPALFAGEFKRKRYSEHEDSEDDSDENEPTQWIH